MSPFGATPRSDPAPVAPPTAGATAPGPRRGYFLPEDIAADRWVHLTALILCTVGIPFLLRLAGRAGGTAFAGCVVYSITLVVMFACSTAFYHVPLRIERRRLRQFDHAAIFLLIAGTYTPFTFGLLQGPPAGAITALIWLGALAGAIDKLARPLPFPGFSASGYVIFGGIALIGLPPVLHAVTGVSVILIVAGLSIYGLGATLRRRRSLRYRNTIWHCMVVAGAACHYAAIVHGVVLAR